MLTDTGRSDTTLHDNARAIKTLLRFWHTEGAPRLSAETCPAVHPGAQSAIVKLGLVPQVSARLGRLVDRVVPADFVIDAGERRVLNALGEQALTARAIGHMLDIADAMTFMEELTSKLERFGLGDLIEPGEPQGGEPTYRMRR